MVWQERLCASKPVSSWQEGSKQPTTVPLKTQKLRHANQSAAPQEPGRLGSRSSAPGWGRADRGAQSRCPLPSNQLMPRNFLPKKLRPAHRGCAWSRLTRTVNGTWLLAAGVRRSSPVATKSKTLNCLLLYESTILHVRGGCTWFKVPIKNIKSESGADRLRLVSMHAGEVSGAVLNLSGTLSSL